MRTLMNYIDPHVDGIVVAGGDGAMLEVRVHVNMYVDVCYHLLTGVEWTNEKTRCCECIIHYSN